MATEPDHPIEQTLKTYAEKRRAEAGAPLEMSTGLRRQLLAEAERMHAPVEEEALPTWWAWFQPSTLMAAGFAILALVCATVLFWPTQPEPAANAVPAEAANAALKSASNDLPAQLPAGTLAGNSTPSALAPVMAPVVAALPESKEQADKSAPTMVAIGGLPTGSADGNVAPAAVDYANSARKISQVVAATPPPTANAPVATMAAQVQNNTATDQLTLEAPRDEALRPSKPFDIKLSSDLTGSATQKFARLDANLANDQRKMPALDLLNNFRLEQNQDRVRIVDQDGSVYSGFLQKADDAAPAGQDFKATVQNTAKAYLNSANNQQAAGVTKYDASGPLRNFYFRVTGMNRTLQQPVIFSGNLSAEAQILTNTDLRTTAVSANQLENNQAQSTTTLVPALNDRSRLAGKALVGKTGEVMVNAAATP